MPSTPLYLVTGLHTDSMAAATLGLQFDLPQPVVVRHELDALAGVLRRTVSDITGLLEREVVPLQHACLSCAVREDVVPTLERLRELDRWEAIVLHLPVAADAAAVCRVLGHEPGAAPGVRVAGVIVALDGASLVGDLLGEDLLSDRQPVPDGDEHGVGEVLAALVEYADLVTVFGDAPADGLDLLGMLVRPGVPIRQDWPDLRPAALRRGVHDHETSEQWVAEVHRGPRRDAQGAHAWRMELTASVPLHPNRLQRDLGQLAGVRCRSRGCFWVASRPGQCGVWEGAGGALSIGTRGPWHTRPITRLLFTGLLEDDHRPELRAAFADALLTEAELRSRGPYWEVAADGLEPWLGATVHVA